MNKVALVILLLVVGVLLLVVGAGVGYLYSLKYQSPNIKNNSEAVKALSSNVIPTIVAYGKVLSVQGKNITVSFKNDSITVPIKDGAQIYALVPPAAGAKNTGMVQQIIALKDIKKGNNINIGIKLLPNGQFQGQTVVIFPTSPAVQ